MGATHFSPHENFPSLDDYYLVNLSKTNKYQVYADSNDPNPICRDDQDNPESAAISSWIMSF